ncbi:hypothetical protein H5410_014856 [Solanum commersonii]|uniref:Reverse transcriptase zinc-binding domain-containing protein n=1 Tax=Solanum commersonii TaxID=4109 RepID=A0A9J5ZS79_SOLCO|nr:hypothetical protein H5410_014856 [Solanum commersonii]
MTDCKNVNMPISASELPILSDGTHLTNATRYRRVFEKLQHLCFTRTGIAYMVNKLSQSIQVPSDLHWKVVMCILCYMCGTIKLSLHVTIIDDFNLHVYSYVQWRGDITDRVSTSSYIMFLHHDLIRWSLKKQNNVSRSFIESGRYRLTKGSEYSITRSYIDIRGHHNISHIAECIWSAVAQPKHRFILWLSSKTHRSLKKGDEDEHLKWRKLIVVYVMLRSWRQSNTCSVNAHGSLRSTGVLNNGHACLYN